jgi:segregation and condensation protein A
MEKVGQSQVHDLLFNEKLSWKDIIYDLINTEQLDVWDLDLSLLANKYLEKVRELEEANFFVSSKVLLASSLLLRLKSEIILNHDLPGLDDVLYGKKEDRKYIQERIELDDEIPELIPRTPLPRFKKVTLKDLMSALGSAIKTENRRIKREIVLKQHEIEANINLPRNTINIRDKIREIYGRLKDIFKNKNEKLAFTELVEMEKYGNRDEKVAAFVSLLHLDTQQKIWLEQEGHFDEIWVMMKKMYEDNNKENLDFSRKEVRELEDEIEDDENR